MGDRGGVAWGMLLYLEPLALELAKHRKMALCQFF